MRKTTLFLIGLFGVINLCAQEVENFTQSNYLEDQLYVNFTNNILRDKVSGMSQNGFSGGLGLGFIKDLPINKRRNVGLGLGIGYGYEVYIHNLKIYDDLQGAGYEVVQEFRKNNFSYHALEIPLEFRFRGSTSEKYKFWRMYAGMKWSYLFSSKAVYKDAEVTLKTSSLPNLNKWQYGLTLGAGYGTWNLYVYYGLQSMFKDVKIDTDNLELRELKIGLIFYMM